MTVPMPRSAQSDIHVDVFAEGALRLLRDTTEMRLTAWPVPRAVRRLGRESDWEPFLPEFRLVHPYRPRRQQMRSARENRDQLAFPFFDDTFEANRPAKVTPSQQRRRAFDQFRFSMPKPVAKTLEPFRTNQWPLLALLRYDEGALELAENNPALAYSLAQRMRADRELIQSLQCGRIRQRDLLEVLDLPSSPRAVNLFRKITPASVNGDNWESMVRMIRDELTREKSPLLHLPAINSGVMEILLSPEASRAATQTLLEEVSRDLAESHRGRIVHIINSTLEMQDELRMNRNSTRFANVERLREIHAHVTEQYRRRIRQLIDANRHETDHFRRPPIPGIPGRIEPITSAETLVNEGEEQGNCVASYAVRVREGTTFIYRVLFPERATLSIVRHSPVGDWRIGELEAKYNSDVRDETEDFVQAWLDRNKNLA
jgi:hypothetical protein